MTEDVRTRGLPPRPDPETGEPLPPPGRGWKAYSGSDRKPEHNPSRETRLSHKPHPPPGRGPVLAWHKESKRGKVRSFFGSIIFFAVVFAVLSLIQGRGLDMLTAWPVWLIILAGSWLITGPFTYVVVSVGADWCQHQSYRFGYKRGSHVIDLYDLVKVEVVTGGVAQLYLTLYGPERGIHMALHEWQRERRMWDLVYNGILHSVAKAAKVNKMARAVLEINRPRANRSRDIPVAALDDLQVFELMQDPNLQEFLDAPDAPRSAAEFRKVFPALPEEALAHPANPGWFKPQA
ncbi:MAG: hypothetical protein GEU97_22980 [Actinophytocola sp.]|nr:hypothetical protein [Actinophytocola sp.]